MCATSERNAPACISSSARSRRHTSAAEAGSRAANASSASRTISPAMRPIAGSASSGPGRPSAAMVGTRLAMFLA